jgi:hypothetical protein
MSAKTNLLSNAGRANKYKSVEDLIQKNNIKHENKYGEKLVNATDKNGNTALHIACKYSCNDNAKLLIQNGANKDAKNSEGLTPLDLVDERHKETFKEIFIHTHEESRGNWWKSWVFDLSKKEAEKYNGPSKTEETKAEKAENSSEVTYKLPEEEAKSIANSYVSSSECYTSGTITSYNDNGKVEGRAYTYENNELQETSSSSSWLSYIPFLGGASSDKPEEAAQKNDGQPERAQPEAEVKVHDPSSLADIENKQGSIGELEITNGGRARAGSEMPHEKMVAHNAAGELETIGEYFEDGDQQQLEGAEIWGY